MEETTRHDLFEDNDQTALICVEDSSLKGVISAQLTEIGYKIHTGLFGEDVTLKIRTHPYDVVVIDEHFGRLDLESNPVVRQMAEMPLSQRRWQFVVIIGPNMVTNDSMQAFLHSVDLVVNISDVPNLRVVVRRGVAQHKQSYARMKEGLQAAGMM